MSNYNPDTTLGQIKLDSVAYSAEKLSALINSGFVSKGKYDANKELTIQQVAPLSVITLNKDTYIELDNESKIENDALYLVETDNIDAFQKPVSNVGNPIEANDAANKHYVDTAIQESAQTYNQCDTMQYRPARYYANDGSYCQFTDFMLNEMFYGLEDLDTVKIQEITFIGRALSTDISLSIFDRTPGSGWSSLDESQAIATSTKYECSLITVNSTGNSTSFQFKFTFDNVELSTNTIYTLKFSNQLNMRVIFSSSSAVTEHAFKFGTIQNPNPNGFAAVSYVKFIGRQTDIKTQKFSGVIFSDMQNPDNKYKLCVRNGKISLNLII